MRALLFLLLAWPLVSCTLPGTLDVGYISGSDEGYVQALLAADAWNRACGVELVRVHRGEGDIALREQQGITRGAYGETRIERPIFGAFGEKRAVSIWFMAGWQAPVTVAHEFGHALGLGHASTGIMQPGVYRELLDPATEYRTLLPGVITQADCEAVR